jgi:hypothetical protein
MREAHAPIWATDSWRALEAMGMEAGAVAEPVRDGRNLVGEFPVHPKGGHVGGEL